MYNYGRKDVNMYQICFLECECVLFVSCSNYCDYCDGFIYNFWSIILSIHTKKDHFLHFLGKTEHFYAVLVA